MAEGTWPVPKFYFIVTIDGNQIPCQEVTGLDIQADTIDYRHGDSDQFIMMKVPGLQKASNITVKKGVFEGDDIFAELFKTALEPEGRTERFPMAVQLLNEAGDPVITWDVLNAYPVKFAGTNLKSDSNEIAVETIEFIHEGITINVE